jgi:hypothetical protein
MWVTERTIQAQPFDRLLRLCIHERRSTRSPNVQGALWAAYYRAPIYLSRTTMLIFPGMGRWTTGESARLAVDNIWKDHDLYAWFIVCLVHSMLGS